MRVYLYREDVVEKVWETYEKRCVYDIVSEVV